MSTTIRANKQIQGQLFDWRPTDVLKSPDVTSRLASGTPEGGPDVSGEVGGVKTEILRTPVAICDTQEKVVQRIALRPYQLDAGAAIDAEWARGIRATLLVLATGLGKTVVAADTIRRFLERADRPCLFLAHREELLEQTIRKLADVLLGKDPAHEHDALGEVRQRLFLDGYSTDLEQAEHRASLSARVVVASVQSLQKRRLARFPSSHFGLVIVDEAHHAPAVTYRNVLDHFALAQVLGLTATPDRGDGKALGKLFQTVAYRMEIRAGIAAGFLAPIVAKKISVKSIDLRTIDKVAGDFHHAQLDAMMSEDRTVHGVVSPMVQEVGDRRTIVFCVSVAHAHRMAEVLRDSYGRTAVALDGTAEKDERREVLRAYSRGEFQFLLNCIDEDTEILTSRGWLSRAAIRSGEVVATMAMDGALEWQPISRIVERPRAPGERMVAIKNQTLDVRVTEGHRMVVGVGIPSRWAMTEAKTLPSRQGPYRMPMAAFGQPARRIALSDDECRFIGLWMADGHLDRKGGRGVTISQSTRFQDSNDAIICILNGCCFDWKVTTAHVPLSDFPQNRYRIPKGTIGGKLKRRGFSGLERYLDKGMADELFDLDRDQAKALFEGLWLGDGSKERGRKHRNDVRRSWSIINTNKFLLDRLQQLAVTRGFAANISPPRDNGPRATKVIYTLRIRDRSYIRTNNHSIVTSGGNPSVFESDWREENVWCVTTPNGTIITRRNGKAMVMGQCALFTEGFDSPGIQCVAVARPTLSRGLYVQMVGRGTRPAPGKMNLLLLDFVGNSRHKLVGPADALAGDESAELREQMEKLLGEGDGDVMQAAADAQAALERGSAKLVAVAAYRTSEIDPFLGDHAAPLNQTDLVLCSAETLAALKQDLGIHKPPPNLTEGEAQNWLRAHAKRKSVGLCTMKQCKALERAGINPKALRKMTSARAGELCGLLAVFDPPWHPNALIGQPERIGAIR